MKFTRVAVAHRLWSADIWDPGVVSPQADASAGLQHMQSHEEVGSSVSVGIDLPVRMTEHAKRVGFLLPTPNL